MESRGEPRGELCCRDVMSHGAFPGREGGRGRGDRFRCSPAPSGGCGEDRLGGRGPTGMCHSGVGGGCQDRGDGAGPGELSGGCLVQRVGNGGGRRERMLVRSIQETANTADDGRRERAEGGDRESRGAAGVEGPETCPFTRRRPREGADAILGFRREEQGNLNCV